MPSTDRPILFSAPMVLALLDGRKTQTRRVIKAQPISAKDQVYTGGVPLRSNDVVWPIGPGRLIVSSKPHPPSDWITKHVRFAAGDRLWVKETWRASYNEDYAGEALKPPRDIPPGSVVEYLATDEGELNGRTRVSIHMPKWASRITLHVRQVRVERLQAISETDANREGVDELDCYLPLKSISNPDNPPMSGPYWVEGYRRLWDRINGAGAWDLNPWVVAISFDVELANIEKARKP